MKQKIRTQNKTIAIVIDDDKKSKLIEWSYFNRDFLRQHTIIANDDIALLLHGTLNAPVQSLPHRNHGGYRELASLLENQKIDLLICLGTIANGNNFQVCIGDLLSMATENNTMVASNEATADVILKSLYESESKQLNIDRSDHSDSNRQNNTSAKYIAASGMQSMYPSL